MPLPSPVLYRGVELLVIPPTGTADDARTESLFAADAVVAGVHGAGVRAAPDLAAGASITLQFVCVSRTSLATLNAFLARRRGRAMPFWCPTLRQDAIVTGFGASQTVAERTSYVEAFARIASERNGRDHWAALQRNGTIVATDVTAVTDPGDGTMVLNREIGGTTTAGGAQFCRLEYVRLESDTITTVYRTGHLAEVRLSVISIPREAA